MDIENFTVNNLKLAIEFFDIERVREILTENPEYFSLFLERATHVLPGNQLGQILEQFNIDLKDSYKKLGDLKKDVKIKKMIEVTGRFENSKLEEGLCPSLFHLFCKNNLMETIQYLVEKKFIEENEIFAGSNDDYSPFDFSVINKNVELCLALLGVNKSRFMEENTGEDENLFCFCLEKEELDELSKVPFILGEEENSIMYDEDDMKKKMDYFNTFVRVFMKKVGMGNYPIPKIEFQSNDKKQLTSICPFIINSGTFWIMIIQEILDKHTPERLLEKVVVRFYSKKEGSCEKTVINKSLIIPLIVDVFEEKFFLSVEKGDFSQFDYFTRIYKNESLKVTREDDLDIPALYSGEFTKKVYELLKFFEYYKKSQIFIDYNFEFKIFGSRSKSSPISKIDHCKKTVFVPVHIFQLEKIQDVHDLIDEVTLQFLFDKYTHDKFSNIFEKRTKEYLNDYFGSDISALIKNLFSQEGSDILDITEKKLVKFLLRFKENLEVLKELLIGEKIIKKGQKFFKSANIVYHFDCNDDVFIKKIDENEITISINLNTFEEDNKIINSINDSIAKTICIRSKSGIRVGSRLLSFEYDEKHKFFEETLKFEAREESILKINLKNIFQKPIRMLFVEDSLLFEVKRTDGISATSRFTSKTIFNPRKMEVKFLFQKVGNYELLIYNRTKNFLIFRKQFQVIGFDFYCKNKEINGKLCVSLKDNQSANLIKDIHANLIEIKNRKVDIQLPMKIKVIQSVCHPQDFYCFFNDIDHYFLNTGDNLTVEILVNGKVRNTTKGFIFMTFSSFTNRIEFLRSDMKVGPSYSTLRINRNKIFEDSFKFMNELSLKKWREVSYFTVNFENEPGSDGGGIYRSWKSLLYYKVIERFFSGFGDKSSIHVCNKEIEEKKDVLEFVGKLFAKLLLFKEITNLNSGLSLLFFKKLLNEKICLEDLCKIDKELYNQFKKMKKMKSLKDLNIDFTFYSKKMNKNIELIENGEKVIVNNENFNEFIDAYIKAYFEEITDERAFGLIQDGFFQVIPKSLIKNLFTATELHDLIEGRNKTMDVKKFLSALSFKKNYSVSDTQFLNFKKDFEKLIKEHLKNEEVKRILFFFTGFYNIPFIHSRNFQPKIVVSSNEGRFKLPSAHTCSYEMVCPLYNNYSQMTKAFDCIIQNGGEMGYGFA